MHDNPSADGRTSLSGYATALRSVAPLPDHCRSLLVVVVGKLLWQVHACANSMYMFHMAP